MIGREDGDRGRRRHLGDPEKAVQDGGTGSSVLGLHHEETRGHLMDERCVKPFVPLGEDRDGPLRRNRPRHAPAGSVQESFVVEDRTELLGPVVTRDPPGQGTKSRAVPSGQDQTPLARVIGKHPRGAALSLTVL